MSGRMAARQAHLYRVIMELTGGKPSYIPIDLLSEVSGLGRHCVRSQLQRLTAAGMLTIEKPVGGSHLYIPLVKG